jgi:hypothetical protein
MIGGEALIKRGSLKDENEKSSKSSIFSHLPPANDSLLN